MASQTLTDQTVASTYQGVLHAGGAALPSSSNTAIYDGSGQVSSLSLGLSGQGAAVAGGFSCSQQLTAGDIRYTTTDSAFGANYPLVSDGNKTAVFGQMTSNALIDLSPSPAGTYGNIQYLAVNSKGLVTNVVGGSTSPTAWVTFDGKDVPFTYTVNDLVVTCTAPGHSIATGNIITIKSATNTNLNGSVAVQSADANTFTFANSTGLTTGTGTGIVDVTIKSSYNVTSVARESIGIYRVSFASSFKNKDYITLCGARYPNTVSTDIENLQANTVTAEKTYVRIRSFFVTNGDQVIEYDDGYISVYCMGSTIDDNSPAVFDTFNYTNFVWKENTSPGTQQQVVNITPALMATNKWNAVVLGCYGYMNCNDGNIAVNLSNTVNGSINSTLSWSAAGNSNSEVYIYSVVLYTNNQLKYGLFYSTNSSWVTQVVNSPYDNNSAAASSIYSGLNAQSIVNYNQQIVNTNAASPGNWVTNFLSNYDSLLQNVNSVQLTLNSNASSNGQCNGSFVLYQDYVRYFTAQ